MGQAARSIEVRPEATHHADGFSAAGAYAELEARWQRERLAPPDWHDTSVGLDRAAAGHHDRDSEATVADVDLVLDVQQACVEVRQHIVVQQPGLTGRVT